jgi:hypothetical protein
MYETPADYIARGLGIAPLAMPPTAVPDGTRCAISGKPIAAGYPVSFLVTDATSEFLDMFRGGLFGYVSDEAARCWKLSDPRLGNPTARAFLIFGDGICYMPMISRESARAQGRPCWSELVREVWRERARQRMVCILTTDQKKRLWPRARVGALGNRTPVLLYDAGLSLNETALIDWPVMLDCLAAIEEAYGVGFSKAAIRESLYENANIMREFGFIPTRNIERRLRERRGRREFDMALLIAQKQEKEERGEWTHEGLL